MTKRLSFHWQDIAAAAVVVGFAMAIVVRPLPNLDLWWLLAVGRRIVETHRYIYTDPFSFTLAGVPWSPQSYASAILSSLLHQVGGMAAIAGASGCAGRRGGRFTFRRPLDRCLWRGAAGDGGRGHVALALH
jgi:hypothetical protein